MTRALPRAIRAGLAKKQRRAAGFGPSAPPSPKKILDRTVPIRPVLPPPAVGPGSPPGTLAARARQRMTPAIQPARLTTMRAIEMQKDKDRVRAVEASKGQAVKAFRREQKAVRVAKIAAKTSMTRKNPARPHFNLVSGRRNYSGAFASSPFRTPFQVSYNLRRAFGA